MIALYIIGALLWSYVLLAVLRRLAERRAAQRAYAARCAERDRLRGFGEESMKMQHKGQKYRKWRVIKWKREHAKAAKLIPCRERDPDTVLAQVRAIRQAQEKSIGTLLGFPIYIDESIDVDYSIEFLGRGHNGTE